MYNRYIPQSDGSFLKSPVTESSQGALQLPEPPPISEPSSEAAAPQEAPRDELTQPNLPGVLSQLFPRGIDTEDLIVVLLLLLMSDGKNGMESNAILTLVIYLFL